MASTYVNDLRLNEMATGDQSGSWGTVTNTNLELIAEAFSFGTEGITTNADTHTTTIADGATDPGRSMFLKYTGTLDSACTITIAPNTVSKLWFIENATSGSQNIIISQGSGANVTIPAGDTKAIYSDGAGSGAAMVDAFASLSVVDLKVQDDLTVTDDLIVGGDIDLEGSIDVNGTANLDVVDIDGAVNMATTALVTGVLTTTAATVSNGGGQFNGPVTVGVNDTGYDVKFFGATASRHMTWDESADSLIISGDLDVNDGTIKLDGNYPVGTSNVALGDAALDSLTSGGYSTALGHNALTAQTTGNGNVGVGFASGQSTTSGIANVSVGTQALNSNTTASNNTAVGYQSLYDNTTGVRNSAYGDNSLANNTTANNNNAFGYLSLFTNTTGTANVAMGTEALVSNTTASNNTAVGYQAGYTNTSGAVNSAFGLQALYSNTTANNNSAFGALSLYSNTTGTANTAVGREALTANTTAAGSVAVGYQAAYSTTTGTNNLAVGNQSLLSNTTGINNIAVGSLALYNSTGTANTAIGANSLQANTTASNNIAVGYQAGLGLTTGSNCIFIGKGATESAVGTSNQTVLGTGVTCVGDSNFTFGGGSTDSNIAFGATSISAPSDQRYKEDIADATAGLSFIKDLRPVTFKWKKEKDLPTSHRAYVEGSETRTINDYTNHGFIAQEVKTAIDAHSEIKDGFDMWCTDNQDDGGRQRIADGALVPILVKALQELSAKNDALEARITALEGN